MKVPHEEMVREVRLSNNTQAQALHFFRQIFEEGSFEVSFCLGMVSLHKSKDKKQRQMQMRMQTSKKWSSCGERSLVIDFSA